MDKHTAVLSQSFELVYYDPDRKHDGRTFFNKNHGGHGLEVDQRIAYLEEYARALKKFHELGERLLSYPIVTEEAISRRVDALKEQPTPTVRGEIPLIYWR